MNQHDIDALEAAGFNPIIVDENTDIAVKLETNTQFIDRIMNFGCPTGALIQPFVIQALQVYSKMVSEATQEELPDDDGESFVVGSAWRATAAWLQTELEKKYG